MHPFTPSVLTLALLGSMAALSAHAQNSDPDLSDATHVGKVVVTAAGFKQRIADAPASISVISAEELRAQPYSNLADAVRHIEGIAINGESSANSDISIRGMPGEYTLLLVDGLRQGTRETMNRGTAGVQMNLLPPIDAIERIEVIRGSMSSLYGSDAIGGVINVITKKDPRHFQGTVTLSSITNQQREHGDSKGASFWFGGPLSERVSIQAWANARNRAEDDIFYPRSLAAGTNEQQSATAGVKLHWNIRDYQHLTLTANRDFLQDEWNSGKTLRDSTSATFNRNRHLRSAAGLAYDGQFERVRTFLAIQSERANYTTWTSGLRNGAEPQLTNTYVDAMVTLPLQRQTWKFGGQYITSSISNIAAQDSLPGRPNPDSVNRKTWALFAEDEFRFTDRFKVTAGARADHSEIFGTHITPRLYANYRMSPNWTLRGGVAEGFKEPKIRQSTAGYCMTTGGGTLVRGPLCGNPNLKPETSRTSEIGIRYDDHDTHFGATVFDTRFQNRVASYATDKADPLNPAQVLYVYDNIDRVAIRGVELNSEFRPLQDVKLRANYTYTDSRRQGGGEPAFDGGSLNGYPLDMTPKHVANVAADWQLSKAVSVNAAARYLGAQQWAAFRNGAVNVRHRPAATTFDLGAKWQIHPDLILSAALLNVTNRVVPVDPRGRFEGLDGNWFVDESRRLWMNLEIRY